MSAIHGGTKSKVMRFGAYQASLPVVPVVWIDWPSEAFCPLGK